MIENIAFELVFVSGWQRLVPQWLVQLIGKPWTEQLKMIVDRHEKRYLAPKISLRIKGMVRP